MWWQLPRPTGGHPWPQQALICPKCPAFLSGRLCHDGRMDECWWALVLHSLLTAPLSSYLGGLSRKTKCPSLPPIPTQACMVEVQTTSWANILDGTGPQFLPWMSGTLPAGWGEHPSRGSTLEGHANGPGELTSLLPYAQIQQHVQTYVGGWMGSAVLWHPIGNTHSETMQHLGNVLPPGWTVLLPLPAL